MTDEFVVDLTPKVEVMIMTKAPENIICGACTSIALDIVAMILIDIGRREVMPDTVPEFVQIMVNDYRFKSCDVRDVTNNLVETDTYIQFRLAGKTKLIPPPPVIYFYDMADLRVAKDKMRCRVKDVLEKRTI